MYVGSDENKVSPMSVDVRDHLTIFCFSHLIGFSRRSPGSVDFVMETFRKLDHGLP